MYGMQKGAGVSLAFGLEEELKGANRAERTQFYKEFLSSRIEELKTVLRKGENKSEFEEAEELLHGYIALQKVIEKIKK